jgi:hypothetical protein
MTGSSFRCRSDNIRLSFLFYQSGLSLTLGPTPTPALPTRGREKKGGIFISLAVVGRVGVGGADWGYASLASISTRA